MSYLIYRGSPLGGLIQKAEGVTFDNTGTGLSASDVQGAIEEVVETSTGTFTPETGVTSYSTVRRKGFIAQLNLDVQCSSSSNTWATIGTSSIKPANPIYGVLCTTAHESCLCRVDTSGTVLLLSPVASKNYMGTIVFYL